MSEVIYLQGSEAVEAAGHRMRAAAEEMTRAATQIDSSLEMHRRFMDDWLTRLEALLREED